MQCKMAFGQHSQFCDVSYSKAILIRKSTINFKENFKNIRLVCLSEYIINVFVNKIILLVYLSSPDTTARGELIV